ncbi:CDP-glycerol glycerophosphotransferase family protein [Rhizorhabdus dicambivorans]|uniref:CDP-glycerol glycerophosphotransferase family protein n=1 Tax=Rhizorhabdus dicambivorans TaxID=1850238 RepID=UPI000ACADA81|nr:CDP-glycerol glycerophosphotransferase family protein [Rhizorhabdus dicambivorans]
MVVRSALARMGKGRGGAADMESGRALQTARGAASRLPRVAFLFNAQAHQILHGITTAEALAVGWQVQVDILSASSGHLDLARSLVLLENRARLGFERIGSPLLHRSADLLRSAVPPKLLTLFASRKCLNGYDAIALPERTSTIMRRFGVKHPRLIHVDHGAGDRAAGFDPRIALFDFALVAGEKQRRRMLAEGLIRPGAHATVGYPKFEAADRLRDPDWYPFAERRPVVLYNPHFSPSLGSWPRDGVAIVDAIARDGRFNLIVAPHIRMCDSHRNRMLVEAALKPYDGLPNVHIDLGSRRSIDMSYTMLADIYVGDVSSQVYEFLRTPKPVLFVDSHARAWRDDPDFAHWHFGPVIEDGTGVIAGIEDALASHDRYAEVQRRAFADTFDLREGESHSVRAAAAIADFLGLEAR